MTDPQPNPQARGAAMKAYQRSERTRLRSDAARKKAATEANTRRYTYEAQQTQLRLRKEFYDRNPHLPRPKDV